MPITKKLQKLLTALEYGRGLQGKLSIATLFCKHGGLLKYRGNDHLLNIPTKNRGAHTLHLRDAGPDAVLFSEILAENDYSALHQLNLKPQHIFDIGANIGLGSFYLRYLFPESTLHGFEPSPAERTILERNYTSWGQATAYPYAIGNQNSDEILFAVHPDKTGGQHLVDTTDVSKTTEWEHIPVQLRRMDQLFKQHSLPIPDLVKMDIEGAELDALDGFGDMLAQPRAYILETHSKELHHNCITKLSSAGFRIISDLPRSRDTHILLMARPSSH